MSFSTMSIDLNDVVVFTEVVTCGSFTAAGKKLGLSEGRLKELIQRLNIVPR